MAYNLNPFISIFGIPVGWLCYGLQAELVLFEQPLLGKLLFDQLLIWLSTIVLKASFVIAPGVMMFSSLQ